ncbi:MAG: LptF/LptG family permease, partial [Syntrophorhabdales bacterium]
MRRLSKYIISNTIKLLIISEFAGLVIFTMIDFFDHLDVFTQSFSKFGLGLLYVALNIPNNFNVLLPLAFLISMLVLIIMMIRGNEVIIVRTAGISTFSLMKPLLSLSLVLVVASFCFSEWIIPFTSSAAEYMLRVRIKEDPTYVVFKNDKIWFKRGNKVCNIDFYDVKRDQIKGITLLELSDDYSIQKRYDARLGVWEGNEKQGQWVFTDVAERTFRNDGIESRTTHKTMTGLITEPPS